MESFQEAQITQTQQKLNFYKKILDVIPALVYINEFTKPGDTTSLRNVWSNRFALQFIGYSQEEIEALGFDFFTRIIHPDDLEIIKTTMKVPLQPEMAYTFLYRLKAKGNDEYTWMYGNGLLLESYESGFPKTTLNVVLEISTKMHTENQLVSALKEINRLKNELRCKSLTKRERELLGFIAEGFTDKEIAIKLNISPATAKTHRNKIIKKLGLKNTASMAAFAVECGLR